MRGLSPEPVIEADGSFQIDESWWDPTTVAVQVEPPDVPSPGVKGFLTLHAAGPNDTRVAGISIELSENDVVYLARALAELP